MFSYDKPFTTMDDRKAERIGPKLKGRNNPNIVVVTDTDGDQSVETYTDKGIFLWGEESSCWDLVNTLEEE